MKVLGQKISVSNTCYAGKTIWITLEYNRKNLNILQKIILIMTKRDKSLYESVLLRQHILFETEILGTKFDLHFRAAI